MARPTLGSAWALLTRAWTCHAGLIRDGTTIDCNVSLYELSYAMSLGLPKAMLYPCSLQDHTHAMPHHGIPGTVPREPMHAHTDGPRATWFVGNLKHMALGGAGITPQAEAYAYASTHFVLSDGRRISL